MSRIGAALFGVQHLNALPAAERVGDHGGGRVGRARIAGRGSGDFGTVLHRSLQASSAAITDAAVFYATHVRANLHPCTRAQLCVGVVPVTVVDKRIDQVFVVLPFLHSKQFLGSAKYPRTSGFQ